MKKSNLPIVYTPDNEPYFGRSLVFHLDQIIVSTMDINKKAAKKSRKLHLSDHQKMASQIIPQTLSIILSIRELIRQGYLFSGFVLLRAVVERVAIILYLSIFPEKVNIWNNGWNQKEAPNLATMLDEIKLISINGPEMKGKDYTAFMNSLVHGKPDSAFYSIVNTSSIEIGHSASKNLDRPDLCDDLCADLISWIAVIQVMMIKYFIE